MTKEIVQVVLRTLVVALGLAISAGLVYRGNTYVDPNFGATITVPMMFLLTAIAVSLTSLALASKLELTDLVKLFLGDRA